MSQYTKSGFSRPFGCCGHWEQCQLGKLASQCFYVSIDPVTMTNCVAYQLNRKKEENKMKLLKDALLQYDKAHQLRRIL
ncbi:hypothetical protein [Bacillus sp. 1P06AnD]|uniref:hypothetical protein n=1 Tax=Bacillus sp. 1P06AnD TaxID=3132208 RepID=UPI0039A0E913